MGATWHDRSPFYPCALGSLKLKRPLLFYKKIIMKNEKWWRNYSGWDCFSFFYSLASMLLVCCSCICSSFPQTLSFSLFFLSLWCCWVCFFLFFLRSKDSDSPLLEMSPPGSVRWIPSLHMHDRTSKLPLLHHGFIPRYSSLSVFSFSNFIFPSFLVWSSLCLVPEKNLISRSC